MFFLHANVHFSDTAVKFPLALMKTLAHPKNLGNTKLIDMESIHCRKM